MNDLTIAMLNYALDHQIGFQCMMLHEKTPSCSITKNRLIIINLNWWRKSEIPFIIAHEISHILHEDINTNYYDEYVSVSLKKEKLANIGAVDILIPEYFKLNADYSLDTVMPIINQLCIPLDCINEVIKVSRKYIWYK